MLDLQLIFKVENRLLKQKIKDLQEIVDSLRSKKIINDEQLIMGHIVENVDGETATTFTGAFFSLINSIWEFTSLIILYCLMNFPV